MNLEEIKSTLKLGTINEKYWLAESLYSWYSFNDVKLEPGMEIVFHHGKNLKRGTIKEFITYTDDRNNIEVVYDVIIKGFKTKFNSKNIIVLQNESI